MDNCWLPLALYDIFRHHPVFIYIISNLKYCVTPPFDLNVIILMQPFTNPRNFRKVFVYVQIVCRTSAYFAINGH